MLTGITLENFKAFKEPQFIPIKPITLVFGPNNAGKSSIIHALAFLKHVHDTNGDCNPRRIDYGWSNLDLGSWKNLVFGQNENASMMIRLETKTTAIRWRFKKARVASFEIEEKFGDEWIATAKGKNIGDKGIMWEVELHYRHSLWQQYREALWDRVIGHVSFRDSVDKHGWTSRTPVFDDEACRRCAPELRERFEKHFDLWLGDKWRTPPLECNPAWADTTDAPFEGLFPRQVSPNSPIQKKKKTERGNPIFGERSHFGPDEKTLDEGTLPHEECPSLLDDFWPYSVIWPIVDALHVEELLSSFVSHLHLDAQRFPPNGTLSKNRLSPNKPADQPWIKLLDVDYQHHFYAGFIGSINYLKSELGIKIPDAIVAEIQRSSENHELRDNWPEIRRKLDDAGLDNNEIEYIQDLFNDQLEKAKLGDISPILAANTALQKLGIQYSLEMRKRVETIYAPKIDPRRGDEVSGHEASENWDAELVFIGKSGVHTLHNLGSGVRVIVPVIVALTSSEVNLLSIEEPECHVHPKLQTELGDLLIQRLGWTYYVAPEDDPDAHPLASSPRRLDKEHRRKSYTLVETHSEHLILRILKRIRQTTIGKLTEVVTPISKDDIAVLFVSPSSEGSSVRELRITDHGKFVDSWPGGFFEESFDEMF
jgi:hypothetical protein